MADQDIQSYLTDKMKTSGASSMSKGGVTVSNNAMPNPSTPIDARSHKPGPLKTATDHHWK